MSLSVVILAAGKGTRMQSSAPKVLHRLAGKPLLGHVLDAAQALSAANVVVVYGHGGEAVPERFRDSGARFVLQEPRLGTGHALLQAMPHVPARGTTLVLYGDVPLTQPRTLQSLLASPNALSILTCSLDQPHGYGRIVRDANGRMLRIVEEKDATADEKRIGEINTGILAAPSDKLRAWLAKLDNRNAQGEYYLTDVVPQAIADGTEVCTQQPQAIWEVEGVNSREQLARLERQFQQERAHELMAQGVTLADPARFDVRGTLACSQDVFIDVGCVFEGSVKVGSNAIIGAYCVIKDSEIGAGTQIAPFTHMEGALIGAKCHVGPYARLRPGANLATEVHVGNFVEVKNTSLGAGSKANHLTYLGDAVIGREVNIGAGTITCNYDGANKFTTVIEDGVFVGSDTALVAPVTVGHGATIAAGTTVWKDAPPDSLVLNEKTQIAKPGWQRPKRKQR